MQSSGELENDERTAGVIMQMIRTACRFRLHGAAEPPLKRMSGETSGAVHSTPQRRAGENVHSSNAALVSSTVMFEDYVYAVTVSGQKVFVVKRQNNQREPVTA